MFLSGKCIYLFHIIQNTDNTKKKKRTDKQRSALAQLLRFLLTWNAATISSFHKWVLPVSNTGIIMEQSYIYFVCQTYIHLYTSPSNELVANRQNQFVKESSTVKWKCDMQMVKLCRWLLNVTVLNKCFYLIFVFLFISYLFVGLKYSFLYTLQVWLLCSDMFTGSFLTVVPTNDSIICLHFSLFSLDIFVPHQGVCMGIIDACLNSHLYIRKKILLLSLSQTQ